MHWPIDTEDRPILKAVNDIDPRWLFTVGTDGLTGHPDHILIRRGIDAVMQQLGSRAPAVLGSQVRTSDVELHPFGWDS